MRVFAYPQGLAADGAGLAAQQFAARPRACAPPAADPVSVSIAAQLSARGASLEALLAQAALMRTEGGAATQHTSFLLAETDRLNAAMFTDGMVAPFVATPMTGAAPAAVHLPVMPAAVQPPVMPGEALSRALHDGGPGPDSLRDFASHWRSRATQLDELANGTEFAGAAIDNDWDDGRQRAGANTRTHGGWLREIAGSARQLASTADDYAGHLQRALDDTPTPAEFAQARAAWLAALSDNAKARGMLSGVVSTRAADYAELQARATEAGHTFFASAATTSSDTPKPPSPPPPIAKPDPHPGGDPGSGTPTPAHPSKHDATQLIPHRNGAGSSTATPGTGARPDPDGLIGGPLAPAPDPGAPPVPPPDTSVVGPAANIAGTLVGTGLGAVGELTHGLMPLSAVPNIAAAPLSALSGLSGLPGVPAMGNPSMPGSGMPSDPGRGAPQSDSAPDAGGPFDSTTPAVGGPDTGPVGGLNSTPALSNPLPASAAGPVAGTPSATSAPIVAASGPGVGGMGMYPPLMPRQGGQGSERNKDLYPDKRVVLRPVANTEAVFGELEKQRRPRTRAAQEEGDSGAGKD